MYLYIITEITVTLFIIDYTVYNVVFKFVRRKSMLELVSVYIFCIVKLCKIKS